MRQRRKKADARASALVIAGPGMPRPGVAVSRASAGGPRPVSPAWRTGASAAYTVAAGANTAPVGDPASAIRRFIHALATSITSVFAPGRSRSVRSTCHGGVHMTPQSISVDDDRCDVTDVLEDRS